MYEAAKNMYEANQNAINDLFTVFEIVLKVAKSLDKECDYESYESTNHIKKKNLDRVKEIMSECYGNKELDDYTPKFDALDIVLIYARSKSNTNK
jgi:hypothetical protein